MKCTDIMFLMIVRRWQQRCHSGQEQDHRIEAKTQIILQATHEYMPTHFNDIEHEMMGLSTAVRELMQTQPKLRTGSTDIVPPKSTAEAQS